MVVVWRCALTLFAASVAACSFTPGKYRASQGDDANDLDAPSGDDDANLDGPVDVPAGTTTFGERSTAEHKNVTVDTYIESANPTTTRGTELGIWGDASPTTNGLLRFDLSALPPGTPVKSVELHVATNADSLENGTMQFYPVLEAWREVSATWNERSPGVAWAGAGATGASRGAQLLGEVAPNVDLTPYTISMHVPTIQGWIDDPATNFGMVMISTSQAGNGGMFSSREDVDAARPMLQITYGP